MHSPRLDPAPGRFLHVVNDDKYIDAARKVFEAARPGAHDYLLPRSNPAGPTYLRTFQPTVMNLGAALRPAVLGNLPRYSAIFIHFLSREARRLVEAAPAPARMIWLGWGSDYYHLIQPHAGLYLPQTARLVAGMGMRAPGLHGILHLLRRDRLRALHPARIVSHLRRRLLTGSVPPGSPREMRIINRFHAVAMPIIEDYTAIRARHTGMNVPFLDWNYWTEGFRADACPPAPTSHNILLGNSAIPENNHLEALQLLATCELGNRKVICPLSYGDSVYADAIAAAGTRLLGDRFVPLRSFMEPRTYAELLAGCSILVMNQLRQQSLGNIVLGLCSGAHVFFNAASPVRAAMQRLNVPVQVLEDLPRFLTSATDAMPRGDLGMIRERVEQQYGYDSILRRTKLLLDQLG
jgi:dTDP-N-acetylfucosamine:lipid II N-acetylfucosaminyltransferase